MRRFPMAFYVGATITLVIMVMALLSFIWTPYAVESLNIAQKLQPPSQDHLFGTDHFGRDILSMIMVGARTSIAVAIVAVGIGMIVGVPLGLMAAAQHNQKIDHLIMRGNDLAFAFPGAGDRDLDDGYSWPIGVSRDLSDRYFQHPCFCARQSWRGLEPLAS